MNSKLRLLNPSGDKINEISVTPQVISNIINEPGEVPTTIKVDKETYEVEGIVNYIVEVDTSQSHGLNTIEVLVLEVVKEQ